MRQLNLHSKQRLKHRYRHVDAKHYSHDNVLNRAFNPKAPNQVWTGDVTYIRTKQGFCYLAAVIDLYARNIVGFAVSDSPDSQLTTNALKMADVTRFNPKDVLFHSDQGMHYSSQCFAEQIAKCTGMKHSMSRKGTTRAQPLSCVGAKQCFLIPSSGIMPLQSASLEAIKQNGCQNMAATAYTKQKLISLNTF